jgi:hypothetical protein
MVAVSIQSTGISRKHEAANGTLKPLAVSIKRACATLGIGSTKMWELIGAGRVKTISIGRRRLVVFASLEALVASAEDK